MMSAAAQPARTYVFSERIGSDIDAEERAYFGLFPDVEEYVRAEAFEVDDSVRVAIRTSEADSVLMMARSTSEALGRFVETFERHPAAFRNPDWQVVSRFVRADIEVPYVSLEEDVRLDVADRRYSGIVLQATDSLVLIQPVRDYDWKAREALALPVEDVEWVGFEPRGWERYEKTAPLVSGGIAGLVATGVGSSLGPVEATVPLIAALAHEVTRRFWPSTTPPGQFDERRGEVQRRARFEAGQRPFDLAPISAFEGREGYSYKPVPPPPSTLRAWHRRYGLLSLGFLASNDVSMRPETSIYTEFFRGSGTRESSNIRNALGITSGVDLSLRPVPWVRFGGTWQSRDTTEPEELLVEVVSVEPSSMRAYAELVVPSPQFGNYRLDVAGGIGLEQNNLVVQRAVEEDADQSLAYREEERAGNTYYQGAVELFTSQRTSFFLRFTYRSFSRTVDVEGIEVRVPGLPDNVSYRLDPHEVQFNGYSELVWGTRLHF